MTTPAMNGSTASVIKASLNMIGRDVNQTEMKLAPTSISEKRTRDFDIRSRRYGSNMGSSLTKKNLVVKINFYNFFNFNINIYLA